MVYVFQYVSFLLVGSIYTWKCIALNWGDTPSRKAKPSCTGNMPRRTAQLTFTCFSWWPPCPMSALDRDLCLVQKFCSLGFLSLQDCSCCIPFLSAAAWPLFLPCCSGSRNWKSSHINSNEKALLFPSSIQCVHFAGKSSSSPRGPATRISLFLA